MVGESLDAPAPFRYPLWLAAAVYIPGLLTLLATRCAGSVSSRDESGLPGPAPTAVIVVLGAVALLRMTAAGALQSFFNVYLDSELRLPPATIGTLMATGQLLGGVAALAAPILMERAGKCSTYAVSSLGTTICHLPLVLVEHWLAAAGGFLGVTAAGSIARPTAGVYGQEAVEPRWRTAVSATATTAMGLGYAVAGLVGGSTITSIGYRPFFAVAGLLPAAGGLLFWGYFRRKRPRMRPASAHEVTE
jgi:predicted MFS family arabinose efflux permease